MSFSMKRNFLLLVGTVMAAVHGCHSEIEPSVKIETAKNSTIQLPQNSTESEANSNSAAQAKEHVDNKGDWPLFRGNAESQGVATSSLPKKLDEIWKYEIKDGAFEGSPIIAGEKDKTVYIGDADGRVLAFNLNDGKVRWEVKTEWGFASSPAFKNVIIYIGVVVGKFFCFNEMGYNVWESKAEFSIDS
ncbi:MAG: PQQ-binding-like beta-propeller repeat protein, partial [Planctomycetota bacterium]